MTASSCAECLVGDGNLLAALHAMLRREPSWEGGRDACARAFLHGNVLCHQPVALGSGLQLWLIGGSFVFRLLLIPAGGQWDAEMKEMTH